jgi:hypothetical protein
MTELATTYSEEQRIEILAALAASDGMPKHAQQRLAEHGIDIPWEHIKLLREAAAGTYQALAAEITRAQEEALTLEYRELARLGQRVTRNYLEHLIEAQEDGTLDYTEQKAMPQVVQAMAKVMQVTTDKLLSLTGRPVDGSGGDSMLESLEFLQRIGVIDAVARPAIEGTAEEVKR